MDASSGTFRTIKLRPRNPNCEVCADKPSITQLIDYVQFCGAAATDKAITQLVLTPSERISCLNYSELNSQDKGGSHILLDVRETNQFAIASLPGSLNVPWRVLPRRLAEVLDAVGHNVEDTADGKKTKPYLDLEVGQRYSVVSTYVPTQPGEYCILMICIQILEHAKSSKLMINPDELYLNVGDVVIVEETFNDGWALARNEKTNESGLIPTNFVIKYVPNATDRATTATALKRVASLLYKKGPTKPLNERQAEVQKKLDAINAGRDGRARVASNIGSLKVLVVGDSGIGKTSLIQSFFDCPEINEHDDIPPKDGVPAIKELRASTIPPAELHTGEEPYNLTFVDSPGFGTFMDAMMIIRPIIDYHTAQFAKTDKVFVKGTVLPNLVKFLNSGTGCHTHVDACIYCILHRLKPVDIEFMRQLSTQVTVIPVIVKSDTLKISEVFQLKISVLEEIAKANIPVYGFGLELNECQDLAAGEVPGAIPFVVSSPSAAPKGALQGALNEFETLKKSLFYNHIDDLRQLSAERFVSWRSARSSGGR
ncbi:hypothetical protein HDU97_001167 [Phlyctochytrium planicorne]|nr:hypothetical protein HDU97_001167 [Phlyctochytrium planicorne]